MDVYIIVMIWHSLICPCTFRCVISWSYILLTLSYYTRNLSHSKLKPLSLSSYFPTLILSYTKSLRVSVTFTWDLKPSYVRNFNHSGLSYIICRELSGEYIYSYIYTEQAKHKSTFPIFIFLISVSINFITFAQVSSSMYAALFGITQDSYGNPYLVTKLVPLILGCTKLPLAINITVMFVPTETLIQSIVIENLQSLQFFPWYGCFFAPNNFYLTIIEKEGGFIQVQLKVMNKMSKNIKRLFFPSQILPLKLNTCVTQVLFC